LNNIKACCQPQEHTAKRYKTNRRASLHIRRLKAAARARATSAATPIAATAITAEATAGAIASTLATFATKHAA
jgi:hypothetical protein